MLPQYCISRPIFSDPTVSFHLSWPFVAVSALPVVPFHMVPFVLHRSLPLPPAQSLVCKPPWRHIVRAPTRVARLGLGITFALDLLCICLIIIIIIAVALPLLTLLMLLLRRRLSAFGCCFCGRPARERSRDCAQAQFAARQMSKRPRPRPLRNKWPASQPAGQPSMTGPNAGLDNAN